MAMAGKEDIKALQARLADLKREREAVDRRLERIGPPHPANPGAASSAMRRGPAPEGRRDGGLLARLGGKRGRDDDNDGGNGPRGRSRSRSRGRDRHREGGEGGPPRSRRRLASAVGAPDAGVAAGTWEEVPEEDEEGQVAEEGVVHTKRAFKPRGTGPAMDDPEADRFDPLLNGGRGGASVGGGWCRGWARRGGGKKEEELLLAEERGEVPEIYKKEEVVKRNRRMFGALMGHLGKARDRLAKDEGLLEKQKQRLTTLAEKEKEESARIKHELTEGRAKERKEELKKRAALMLEQRRVEGCLEVARCRTYWGQFQGKFVLTKAEPPLFYIPSKLTGATRALLAECEEMMEAKVQEKMRAHEEQMAALEAEFKARWETKEEELEEGDEPEEKGEGEKAGNGRAPAGGEDEEPSAMEQDKEAGEVAGGAAEGATTEGEPEEEGEGEAEQAPTPPPSPAKKGGKASTAATKGKKQTKAATAEEAEAEAEEAASPVRRSARATRDRKKKGDEADEMEE